MENKPVVIDVDMNKKCLGCGRRGPTQTGYCFTCISVAVNDPNSDKVPQELRDFVKEALMSGKITLQAEITDVHPRVTRDKDGMVKKWTEIRISTHSFNPDEIQALVKIQGADCVVEIAQTQPNIPGVEG